MSKAPEALLADALRLDVKARAGLAAELLASLDGPADPDAEQAWATAVTVVQRSFDRFEGTPLRRAKPNRNV